MLSTIAVEKLRVGMFVHLEGGWLSHPFPRSAFRIGSDEQLATLRGLGLKQVRWSPEKSDVAADALPAGDAARAGSEPHAARADGDTGAADGSAPSLSPDPRPDANPTPDPEAHARRRALQAQREALQRCEHRYSESARRWRETTAILDTRPDGARQASVTLAQAMLDDLLVDSDIAIRLVNGAGGDRAAAHALNVSVISMLIGRTLKLSPAELLDLGVGALMHDIGKLELAERLRHADEGFSTAEISGYRDHVAKGVAQGRRLGLADDAMAVIAQHHEHADGSGFPQRLAGDAILRPARIVAIVNRYDNLCNPPARVHPLTPHEAVANLFAQGRTRFDAVLLSSFIRMMGVYPAGSLVQLTDQRYAMVVAVNSSRPLKPRVLVHEPGVPRSEALLLNLEDTPEIGIRRSLQAARLPADSLEYLDPRPRVAYYFEALTPAPRQEPAP